MKKHRRTIVSVLAVLLIFCMTPVNTAMAEESVSPAEPAQVQEEMQEAEETAAENDGDNEAGEISGIPLESEEPAADVPEDEEEELPATSADAEGKGEQGINPDINPDSSDGDETALPDGTAEPESAGEIHLTETDIKTTVLYSDGTLVINELAADRDANLAAHGTVKTEYDPWSEDNPYNMASAAGQPWVSVRSSITAVTFGSAVQPASTAYWFANCKSLRTFDGTALDMSKAVSTSQMFSASGSWNSTDGGGITFTGMDQWDVSNVTDLSSMFASAYIKSFDDFDEWTLPEGANLSKMLYKTSGKLYFDGITIPTGCNLESFAEGAQNLRIHMTMLGLPSNDANLFLNTSGGVYGSIFLMPTSDETEEWCYAVLSSDSPRNIRIDLPGYDLEVPEKVEVQHYDYDNGLHGVLNWSNRDRDKWGGYLNVEFAAQMEDGWELVAEDTDFAALPDNSRQLAITAADNYFLIAPTDLSKGPLRYKVQNFAGYTSISLNVKTGLWTQAVENEKFATFVLTISHSYT